MRKQQKIWSTYACYSYIAWYCIISYYLANVFKQQSNSEKIFIEQDQLQNFVHILLRRNYLDSAIETLADTFSKPSLYPLSFFKF